MNNSTETLLDRKIKFSLDFIRYNTPSVNCYAWYVWKKGFQGETTLRWFSRTTAESE